MYNVCQVLSLRANDAAQLSSTRIDGTWQRSTEALNRVDHCMVLWCTANCDFWRFVPANVAAAFSCRIVGFGRQISGVLGGPAVRTLCSCWNHEDCRTTSHVANCTRRRVIKESSAAVVALREYVIAISSRIEQFIFYSGNFSRPCLMTRIVTFPLWIVR